LAGNKISNTLATLSSAAILAIYAAGYHRTAPAAARFAAQTEERLTTMSLPGGPATPGLNMGLPGSYRPPDSGLKAARVAELPTPVSAPPPVTDLPVALGTAESKPAAAENSAETPVLTAAVMTEPTPVLAPTPEPKSTIPAEPATAPTPAPVTEAAPAVAAASTAPVTEPEPTTAPAASVPAAQPVDQPEVKATKAAEPATAEPPAAPAKASKVEKTPNPPKPPIQTKESKPSSNTAPQAASATATQPAAQPAEETAQHPAAQQAPPAPVLHDGTYYGWGTSRHGDIQAEIVIAAGRISSARISRCETRYPCSYIENAPGQVIQRQSPAVDVVAGCTQSIYAFYYAVLEALAQAR
jgi:uncharacterized protein with FMN-binding domain